MDIYFERRRRKTCSRWPPWWCRNSLRLLCARLRWSFHRRREQVTKTSRLRKPQAKQSAQGDRSLTPPDICDLTCRGDVEVRLLHELQGELVQLTIARADAVL